MGAKLLSSDIWLETSSVLIRLYIPLRHFRRQVEINPLLEDKGLNWIHWFN